LHGVLPHVVISLFARVFTKLAQQSNIAAEERLNVRAKRANHRPRPHRDAAHHTQIPHHVMSLQAKRRCCHFVIHNDFIMT